MVLTQIMGNGGETEYHAKSLHTAEYRLLCIASYIKTVGYDGYIKSNNIKGLPGAYIHISLICTIFNQNFASTTKAPIWAHYWMMTMRKILLHCHFSHSLWPLCFHVVWLTEVMKFTGNSGLGLAKDLMTQVIHTFSHFAYVYSWNNLYFCNLQGMTDKHRVMTLFDPQCHL